MIARVIPFAALLALAFVGGCSPYVDEFRYAPHPAMVELRSSTAATQPAPAPEGPPVMAFATVIGVRREDSKQHIPLSVEVRLRLDNHGMAPVTLDPRTMELSNAELWQFPPPMIQPQEPVTLGPGQSVVAAAYFPFPAGYSYTNTNLETLQLQWALQIDGHPIMQHADFHRIRYYYYDPYWDYAPYPYGYPYYPYPYVGIGFGYHGRWR